HRDAELLRDRYHDEQEDRVVEGVEHPAGAGCDPSVPLVFGGLSPPCNGHKCIGRYCHGTAPTASQISFVEEIRGIPPMTLAARLPPRTPAPVLPAALQTLHYAPIC